MIWMKTFGRDILYCILNPCKILKNVNVIIVIVSYYIRHQIGEWIDAEATILELHFKFSFFILKETFNQFTTLKNVHPRTENLCDLLSPNMKLQVHKPCTSQYDTCTSGCLARSMSKKKSFTDTEQKGKIPLGHS
jgi:hypothetical protein